QQNRRRKRGGRPSRRSGQGISARCGSGPERREFLRVGRGIAAAPRGQTGGGSLCERPSPLSEVRSHPRGCGSGRPCARFERASGALVPGGERSGSRGPAAVPVPGKSAGDCQKRTKRVGGGVRTLCKAATGKRASALLVCRCAREAETRQG